jgi:hypothetical protein
MARDKKSHAKSLSQPSFSPLTAFLFFSTYPSTTTDQIGSEHAIDIWGNADLQGHTWHMDVISRKAESTFSLVRGRKVSH